MRNIVRQTVTMPAPAPALFEMYLSPADHAAFTGSPVTIGPDAGCNFQAFGGVLTGTILAVIRPTLIVQSWRSTKFRAEDPDSTLILAFSGDGNSGRIDLVHLDVPDHDYEGVTEGWEKFYWAPWRQYLSEQHT